MSNIYANEATPTAETRDSIILATVFGLLAAVGYTAANVFLRAASHEDACWVSAVKAVPTVLIFAPWLLVRMSRSQALLPPLKPYLLLVAAAVVGQAGGNVTFQWAISEIGIALTVPLCLGTLIVAGAWMGRSMLGEGVTLRNVLSMVVLITAIVILSLGAPKAQASMTALNTNAPLVVAAAVLGACFSGVVYAVLGVAIRHAARQGSPVTTTLVTVGLAGVLVLFPWTWYRIGWEGMQQTSWGTLAMMIGAGLMNAAAFFALTKSLQIANVVHVNLLNATQATMAAVAGVVIFHEPLSIALGVGVLLTAGGLVLMKGDSANVKRSVAADKAPCNMHDESHPAEAEDLCHRREGVQESAAR